MRLLYNDAEHRYWYEEKPNLKLTSVSTLIGKYHEKFDMELRSKKYAEKHGRDQQEVKDEWELKGRLAREKGTKYHNMREQELYENANVHRHPIEGDNKIGLDISNLKPGIYPELILDHPYYGLVGTSDKVEIFEDKTFNLSDYKGFPLDTEIPTLNGFKKMKDIIEGDLIFDGQGELTKVKGVSNVHYNPCYKITFDTNEEITCDKDHRWLVYEGVGYKKEQSKVLTTDEIFSYFTLSNKRLKIKNTKINLPEIDLPIDPYVLGCWLGDGSKQSGVITNMNLKLWEEIEKRGYRLSSDISGGSSGKAQSRTVYKLSTQLRKFNLLNNKHIPDMYMSSSHQQRLDLLRGFMDTDGHFNKTRKRCVMSTTSKWQANAISNLVFSLGGKATILPVKKKGFGKTDIPGYDVCFTIKESPFLTRNFDYSTVTSKSTFYVANHRYIKSIKEVETVPTRCLTVESNLHTYLVTRNYIPTHNTNEKLEFSGFMVFNPTTKRREEKKMFSPLSHLPDANGIHYSLQLSLYAYFLEERGYKLKDLWIEHIIFEDDEHINVIKYPINYLKKDVITLCNHYKMNNPK